MYSDARSGRRNSYPLAGRSRFDGDGLESTNAVPCDQSSVRRTCGMRECSGEGGLTFSEAYALYGPDVEKIAEAMGIKPTRLIGSSTPQ